MTERERKNTEYRRQNEGRKLHLCLSRRIVAGILVGWLVSIGTAAHAQTNFLWKVRSNTATVYLLGSIHFLKPEAYPLNRAIEHAYESAEFLVVEANVSDLERLNLPTLVDKAFYQGEGGLKKSVSSQTYRLVEKESAALGLPIELVDKQKPWFLALSLQAMALMKTGYDPRHGIDYYFLSKAKGRKTILELENLDEQIDLLAGFSEREQELFLIYTLENLKSIGARVDDVVQAWASGDTEALETILSENIGADRSLAPVFEKLFVERNVKMSSRIAEYLDSGKTYFVVVGAGHLVGEKGIIQLLKEKGYSAEQQ